MPEDIAKILNCPACGAPLEFDGASAVVRCKFCRNVSVVPHTLAPQAAAPGLALDEIRRLAKSGSLEDAIRLYREAFGGGLGEARDALDALRADRLAKPAEAGEGAPTPEQQTRTLEEIQKLLAGGNKIEAIKRYRQVFDVSLARAKYALDQIEAGQTAEPEAGFRPQAGPSASPDRTGARLSCAIAAGVLIFVGGILALIFLQPGGPFTPRYFINGPAILIPSQADAAPDVAALFYSPDSDARMIGLVDGGTGKFRWRAEPLPGDGYADAVAYGPDLIYAADEADLFAYHRSDGSLAWQAQMTDRLNYDAGALAVAGDRLVTSNVDQSIQAYDAATGASIWSRRLSGYDRSLRLVGGALVVVDYTDDSYDYRLIFLDPEDGSQQRVITPACQTDEYSAAAIDPDSGLIFDDAANTVTVIYDSSPGCVQRLDLSSGQVLWQSLAGEDVGFSFDTPPTLVDGSSLYFAEDAALMLIDQSTGDLQTLLSNEDYSFIPLATAGETLIVRARRTRGTSRFELWGVDRASGAQVWQVVLDGAEPIDPPDEMAGLIDDSDTGWAWKLTPSGLAMIKFQGKPNQIVVETLDPASGASLGQQTLRLGRVSGDFYSVPDVIGWQGSAAYISLETEIYVLDLAAGDLSLLR